nr:MAG TPA: hypothetical protein [Caudoviricetes sp.]
MFFDYFLLLIRSGFSLRLIFLNSFFYGLSLFVR